MAARKGLPALKITKVRTILTQPAGSQLVIVKVETSEPGLYGIGCATHQERPYAVAAAIEKHIGPYVIGRNCDEIEDIWQSVYVASYFRSGVTLNNALSGLDGALWDILGKRLGAPVYQLLGGKARAAVPLYAHVERTRFPGSGRPGSRVDVQRLPPCEGAGGDARLHRLRRKQRDIRRSAAHAAGRRLPSPAYEPTPYVNTTLKLFEHLRTKLGFDVELLHDVHERVPPAQALQLGRLLEPYRLFFMEDPFSPEDVGWFQIMRQQTSTPIAMGELFVNRNEWLPLVANRWIDFIRCHISAVGGLNMARKIASCCEFFNVRTAWHGPGNVSAVGHAVNMHLDLASTNFGIQEQNFFEDRSARSSRSAGIPPATCIRTTSPAWASISTKSRGEISRQNPGLNRGIERRLDGSVQRP